MEQIAINTEFIKLDALLKYAALVGTPLCWECGVLTTGPPGKSQLDFK